MPAESSTLVLLDCFAEVSDPRLDRCKDHLLIDILFIAICSLICGGDDFTDMEEFGNAKQEWLRQFLELPHGIPSHDTFNRVFARLDPKEFQRAFATWVETVREITQGEVVAVDGKTLRRSHNRSRGKRAIELVSAWATQNRLVLAQQKVAEGSNEITAIPELLRVLYLKGCIVTVDALNCQKEIAAEIRQQDADYVLALKDNHATLKEEVTAFFQAIRADKTIGFEVSHCKTVEKDHGRIETRECWQVNVPDHLSGKDGWRDLRSLAMVEATREIGEQRSVARRYYLSSLAVDAKRINEVIRGHWQVENSQHWVLDVVFREDDSRVREGEAAQNLAVARRLALNLLSREPTHKGSKKRKRLKAALDESYLLQILTT